MKNTRLILSLIGGRWRSFAFGAVFILAANIMQVFIPSFIGRAIDILHTDFQFRGIVLLSLLILAIEFGKSIARFLMRYIMIGTSWEIENDIRLRLYHHLLRLPAPFYNKTRTGDLIARITNDLTAVRMLAGPALMYSINALFLVPLALIFMFSIDTQLAVYAIIPFPFVAVLINRIGTRIHRHFREVQESYSDMSAHVQENLSGIQIVKAYTREKCEVGKFEALSLDYVAKNRKVIILESIFFPLLDILVSAGIIIVLWVGAGRVIGGEISIGTIVAFIMYIGLLVWPFIAMGWVVALFQRGAASAKRIHEILSEPQERISPGKDFAPLKGRITVKNLGFAYNGTVVLDNVSFEINPGKKLAVTGRTGSGKSTLLELLTGAYEIGNGRIFYDGMDINEIPLEQLRATIAYVPQETFLFSETVYENISLGKEGASLEDIRNAAVLASIHEEIETFPKGYNTVLGERGITISAGQRQRLAIARALVSDSPVLFLDDALSNVDAATEARILRNIMGYVKGKTAVIVTQRLGAVKGADEIIYMRRGMIVERGSHRSLVAMKGEYAALYREQETLERLEGI